MKKITTVYYVTYSPLNAAHGKLYAGLKGWEFLKKDAQAYIYREDADRRLKEIGTLSPEFANHGRVHVAAVAEEKEISIEQAVDDLISNNWTVDDYCSYELDVAMGALRSAVKRGLPCEDEISHLIRETMIATMALNSRQRDLGYIAGNPNDWASYLAPECKDFDLDWDSVGNDTEILPVIESSPVEYAVIDALGSDTFLCHEKSKYFETATLYTLEEAEALAAKPWRAHTKVVHMSLLNYNQIGWNDKDKFIDCITQDYSFDSWMREQLT